MPQLRMSAEDAVELGARLSAHRRRLNLSLRDAANLLRKLEIGGIPWDVYALIHVEKGRLAIPQPGVYFAIMDALTEAAGKTAAKRAMRPRITETLKRIRENLP